MCRMLLEYLLPSIALVETLQVHNKIRKDMNLVIITNRGNLLIMLEVNITHMSS